MRTLLLLAALLSAAVSCTRKPAVSAVDTMARATVHERLFLIYRKEGRMDEMKREYEKSFDSLARYARRAGLPPPVTNSYEEFAAKIEMSERGLDVRWKKK